MRIFQPCKQDGTCCVDEEEGPYDDIEEPKDLLGKRLDVLVTVIYCRGLSSKFSSETFVEFDFPLAPCPTRENGR